MKCWYCKKKLKPYEWVYVITQDGERRPVCKDDRRCHPGGIQCHGARPKIAHQAKNRVLERNKRK